MPSAFAIGSIIGVKIMMFGMLSMIIPQTIMIRFINRRIRILLSVTDSTILEMDCGYFSRVMVLANADGCCNYEQNVNIGLGTSRKIFGISRILMLL